MCKKALFVINRQNKCNFCTNMRRTVNFYAIRFSVVKLYAFMYIFQSISIGMCSQNFFYLLFRHTAAVILYRKNKFFRLLLTA